jgi:hypothetical protein
MQVSTMLQEMSADIKNLRFAFPVETRVSTFEGGMLKANFRMASMPLAEVTIQQGKKDGIRLFVEVNSQAKVMTVSEARIQHHVMAEVLALAGFFEATLHNRVFEEG